MFVSVYMGIASYIIYSIKLEVWNTPTSDAPLWQKCHRIGIRYISDTDTGGIKDGAILGPGGAVAPPRFSKKKFSIYIV